MAFKLHAVGFIETPFDTSEGVPIQSGKSSVRGTAVVDMKYIEALDSLALFSHVILLYWFHRGKKSTLKVTPFLDTIERGLFSTRAPSRPNPLGLSIVRLLQVEGNRIHFEGADMLNGTPLLDIKPYIPAFDCYPSAQSGWLSSVLYEGERTFTADARFEE